MFWTKTAKSQFCRSAVTQFGCLGICTFPFNCHQSADHLVEIDDLAVVSEGILSIEVHMFPADRTDLHDAVGQLDILLALRILEELGQDTSVVVDDAVGQQPRALTPELLFKVGPDPQFAGIGVSHGAYQLVVGLTAVQRPLYVASGAQRSM